MGQVPGISSFLGGICCSQWVNFNLQTQMIRPFRHQPSLISFDITFSFLFLLYPKSCPESEFHPLFYAPWMISLAGRAQPLPLNRWLPSLNAIEKPALFSFSLYLHLFRAHDSHPLQPLLIFQPAPNIILGFSTVACDNSPSGLAWQFCKNQRRVAEDLECTRIRNGNLFNV